MEQCPRPLGSPSRREGEARFELIVGRDRQLLDLRFARLDRGHPWGTLSPDLSVRQRSLILSLSKDKGGLEQAAVRSVSLVLRQAQDEGRGKFAKAPSPPPNQTPGAGPSDQVRGSVNRRAGLDPRGDLSI